MVKNYITTGKGVATKINYSITVRRLGLNKPKKYRKRVQHL